MKADKLAKGGVYRARFVSGTSLALKFWYLFASMVVHCLIGLICLCKVFTSIVKFSII